MLLGIGNTPEDISVCCQGVMESQGFVLQKVGSEAVQVIQKGQGFLFCIKANSPIANITNALPRIHGYLRERLPMT